MEKLTGDPLEDLPGHRHGVVGTAGVHDRPEVDLATQALSQAGQGLGLVLDDHAEAETHETSTGGTCPMASMRSATSSWSSPSRIPARQYPPSTSRMSLRSSTSRRVTVSVVIGLGPPRTCLYAPSPRPPSHSLSGKQRGSRPAGR